MTFLNQFKKPRSIKRAFKARLLAETPNAEVYWVKAKRFFFSFSFSCVICFFARSVLRENAGSLLRRVFGVEKRGSVKEREWRREMLFFLRKGRG